MVEELGQPIGKVTHFFGHINVAVIELSESLKVGESIRVIGGNTDFTQPVESLEVDHKKVSEAKVGDSVGLKVSEKAHEGYKVYRV